MWHHRISDLFYCCNAGLHALDFEDELLLEILPPLKIYSNLFSFILFIWEHHADGLQILKSWSCHKKESISGKRREVSSVHQSWLVQSLSRGLDRKALTITMVLPAQSSEDVREVHLVGEVGEQPGGEQKVSLVWEDKREDDETNWCWSTTLWTVRLNSREI